MSELSETASSNSNPLPGASWSGVNCSRESFTNGASIEELGPFCETNGGVSDWLSSRSTVAMFRINTRMFTTTTIGMTTSRRDQLTRIRGSNSRVLAQRLALLHEP